MRLHFSGLFLAAAAAFAFAQGGSAVVTLVLPPPAGQGYSALQSGAALPEGAASLYFNPALLAELQRTKGSQLYFTRSRQVLLPVLKLPDLYQDFWSLAAVAPDTSGGTDMAVGFFRNHINFGENTVTDRDGLVVDRFQSYETVYGLGTAVRLGCPLSFGATIKFIDSHLADGYAGSHAARSFAFDVGAVLHPRLAPAPHLGLPAIEVSPSLALVAKNIGPDVYYAEAWQADPIPTTYSGAFGFRLEAMDVAELEAGADMDYEWTRRSDTLNQVRVLGYSWRLATIRFGESWLNDPGGKRFEKHEFTAVEIDFLNLHRILRRLTTRDFHSPSAALDQGYRFPYTKILGTVYRANPHLEIGVRRIEGRDGGIRNGQKSRYYLVLSI
ncbi:MAG: hypothetical protein ABI036_03825 [Fibrobacteria bacterium]